MNMLIKIIAAVRFHTRTMENTFPLKSPTLA